MVADYTQHPTFSFYENKNKWIIDMSRLSIIDFIFEDNEIYCVEIPLNPNAKSYPQKLVMSSPSFPESINPWAHHFGSLPSMPVNEGGLTRFSKEITKSQHNLQSTNYECPNTFVVIPLRSIP